MVNPAAVRLNLPRAFKMHPTFHISKVKLVAELDLVPLPEPLPPPMFWMGVLPTQSGASWMFVDFEGYCLEVQSWVPRRFIVNNSLLHDFYSTHSFKPGRMSGCTC